MVNRVWALALLLPVAPVMAQDKAAALREIVAFLPQICGSFQTEGKGAKVALDGSATAKLAGLAGKLADLGFTGAGKFESEEYTNVLRADLAGQLDQVRECNLKVYRDFVSVVNAPAAPAGTINQSITGDGNAAVSGDNNSVTISE